MICQADERNIAQAARLACLLWPDNGLEEMERELAALLKKGEAAVFLFFTENRPVGFAQCQLRHDYVEGTDSSPVGYLEGIFVEEGYRGRGIARSLLGACETWIRERGCREFASDCELDNAESLAFHLRCGFAEANRVICFTKTL